MSCQSKGNKMPITALDSDDFDDRLRAYWYSAPLKTLAQRHGLSISTIRNYRAGLGLEIFSRIAGVLDAIARSAEISPDDHADRLAEIRAIKDRLARIEAEQEARLNEPHFAPDRVGGGAYRTPDAAETSPLGGLAHGPGRTVAQPLSGQEIA